MPVADDVYVATNHGYNSWDKKDASVKTPGGESVAEGIRRAKAKIIIAEMDVYDGFHHIMDSVRRQIEDRVNLELHKQMLPSTYYHEVKAEIWPQVEKEIERIQSLVKSALDTLYINTLHNKAEDDIEYARRCPCSPNTPEPTSVEILQIALKELI